MPAHIYARVGDQAAAARANEAGAKADREYFKIAPSDSFYGLAYFTHNLHFLADSEMMRGRLAGARQAAAEVAEKLAPHTQMMPMVESLITMKTAVLLRFGRHDEILALAQPPADHPVEVAWWHFARGVALARTGKADEAATARAALAEASAKVPDEALFGGTGLESAKNILALATTVLDARIAWARGSQADAIRLWTERRRRGRQGAVRRTAGVLLSGARVARRRAAPQWEGGRGRARVPRRSRKASAKCPLAVRPAREPGQTRQERGRRVGEARLRRGVEGRRHNAHD